MGNFYTDKKGRKRPLTPRKGIKSSDFDPHRRFGTNYDDEYNSELEKFARRKAEEFKTSNPVQRKKKKLKNQKLNYKKNNKVQTSLRV